MQPTLALIDPSSCLSLPGSKTVDLYHLITASSRPLFSSLEMRDHFPRRPAEAKAALMVTWQQSGRTTQEEVRVETHTQDVKPEANGEE